MFTAFFVAGLRTQSLLPKLLLFLKHLMAETAAVSS